MKKITVSILLSILAMVLVVPLNAQPIKPGTNNFDFGWQFHRGGILGAENPAFDDSGWRLLDLPHDWSIEDLPGTGSPFDRYAISQTSGGFTTGGTGWYRKSFVIPEVFRGKQVFIRFDGVYMNATVWLNGREMGKHPYGYTSFWFDLTPAVNFGAVNVVAVKVANEGENSRWYSGSGIYRHVWLDVTEPVYVAAWGTFITTPDVGTDKANVNVKNLMVNKMKDTARVKIVIRLISPEGKDVASGASEQVLSPGSSTEFSDDFQVLSPRLWSTSTPDLYLARSEIYLDGNLTGKTETRFGIRSVTFDTTNGFRLNGIPLKLKGGCVHHDNGPLGAKAYDRAEYRRVEILKASGFNAIRCAHNPPSPAFLDACDELGMLVIDEIFDMWETLKNPFDYHLYFKNWWQKDVESMILRDRNHPSVIVWSIGNEIPESGNARGVEISKMMVDYIKKIDPTRPVTSAVNGVNSDKDPFFATLDVAGYNYAFEGKISEKSLYETDHERLPGRIIFCTESFPLLAFGSWMGVLDHPFVTGDFVWTSFDYIGETSIGWRGYPMDNNFFPWNLAYCGDIDICGWKRPQSYYRDVLWKPGQVSLFVKPPVPTFEENKARQPWSQWHWHDAVADWNWQGYEGKPLEVSVYSSCPEVELFLNGNSLGKKKTNRSTEFMAKWNVPWQPGELKATGFDGKKLVAISKLITTGDPSRIRLTADRIRIIANGQDLSYVTVELTDKNGNRHPKGENLVLFGIEGPGKIIAVGNANPVSLESYQLPQRKAWQGRCLVIVKSDKEAGTIRLKATSPGLEMAVLEISSEP